MKSLAFLALMVLARLAYARVMASPHYPPGAKPTKRKSRLTICLSKTASSTSNRSPISRSMPGCCTAIVRIVSPRLCQSISPSVGGPMSDQAVLDRLTISQSARFFFYEWHGQPLIPREEIVAHATNLHLVPLSSAIARQCKALGAGDLVHLRGLLVEATGPDIGTWRSSLSRTDSGRGACELVWVEEVGKVAR